MSRPGDPAVYWLLFGICALLAGWVLRGLAQ